MAGDIVLEILAEEEKALKPLEMDVFDRPCPMKKDGVFCQARKDAGEYGGGEIVEIDEEGYILICFWDKDKGGVRKDSMTVEAEDFAYFTDGRSGRTWYLV